MARAIGIRQNGDPGTRRIERPFAPAIFGDHRVDFVGARRTPDHDEPAEIAQQGDVVLVLDRL
jgi:hypothetical protein